VTLITTATPGSAFAPPEQNQQFFSYLAAQSVALASGVRVIRTNRAALDIPRVNADVSANWTSEASEVTPSDPSADLIVAVPKKLAALTFVSNELVEDSNPDVMTMIAEGLARSMSLKLDLAFLMGSGTAPEPRGLRNVAGISTVSLGANGGSLTSLDALLDGFAALASANASPTAIFAHPRSWSALTKIK
jgi:HK97 family phage major capsid protein